ncbi:hypothetical protein KQI65_08625 [bacterium]|nr:hypothetical protein [bacterium]
MRHISILLLFHLSIFLLTPQLQAQRVKKDTVPRDPAGTSMFVMPTGRTLPGGTGSIGLAAPYIPYAAYSVADNWQISAGGVYVFTTVEDVGEEYYSYLFLKHTLFDDRGTSMAVGGAVMFWGRESVDGPYPGWKQVAIPGGFAVMTFGTESSALTLGLGFANIEGGFGIGLQEGLFSGIGLGYETRIAPEWKLMTEHFLNVFGSGTLHTFGVRYMVGRAAFDMGLIVVPNGDVQIPTGTKIPRALPMVSVSIHIG